MHAVILAGGKGTRLAPYTTVFPKPLMPLDDMPVLEILLLRLKKFGITSVTLAVGHLGSLIQAYFGNGEKLGLQIAYSFEEEPLGTAGPLAGLSPFPETFLVMNGDLLTDLDFSKLIAFHQTRNAVATIGVSPRTVRVELGVVESDPDHRVTGYIEKPPFHYAASMGVYVLDPEATGLIPRGCRFDLPDLVTRLIAAKKPVVSFVHEGYWLDIGNPADYQRAQNDFPAMRTRLIG